jgi:hypothetical protein
MLRVFVSYAKEDRDRVLPYVSKLGLGGYSPWFDEQKILPGQNWEAEIDRAFKDSQVVLLFLSQKSVSKRGFVQREANDAIEALRYKQPTDVYVVPVLLEPCQVPDQISRRLQYIDLNVEGAWNRVLQSLALAAEQQKIELRQGVAHGPFKVFSLEHRETWTGDPGHVIEITYPRFESSSNEAVARELSEFFSGRATRVLIGARSLPWQFEGAPENLAPNAWNGRWDNFAVSSASADILSLEYDVGWYGAGAAHPNSHFEVFNFLLTDRVFSFGLGDLFPNVQEALTRISSICQRELPKLYWQKVGEPPDEDMKQWFAKGAAASFECLENFVLKKDSLIVLFAPYAVGPYAVGSWSVEVSFFELLDLFVKEGPVARALANHSKAVT